VYQNLFKETLRVAPMYDFQFVRTGPVVSVTVLVDGAITEQFDMKTNKNNRSLKSYLNQLIRQHNQVKTEKEVVCGWSSGKVYENKVCREKKLPCAIHKMG